MVVNADSVLVALDTQQHDGTELCCVAIKRARYEGRIYTESAAHLAAAIALRHDKSTAIEIACDR